MDQTQLQQKIVEYYQKLPANVQQIFSRMSWMEVLRTISMKYGLSENQIETLGTETTLAFLGIIHLDEYEENLRKEIQLPIEKFESFFGEMENQILKPIRSQLVNAYTSNMADLETKNEQTSLSPALKAIPESLQKALILSDYQKKLYEIGTKHKLQISLMGILENVTIKLITGAISPRQYEDELKQTTGLSTDTVKEIIADVNTEILLVVRKLMQEKSKQSEEDEVPIPPYALTFSKTMPKTESSIFAKSGIEMVEQESMGTKADEERKVTLQETNILGESGINMVTDTQLKSTEHILANKETQREMLKGIEHPQDVATSIIGDKLGSATISKNSTSDYSLPKMSTQPETTSPSSAPGTHDPYRETV